MFNEIFQPKTIACIELVYSGEKDFSINYCLVKKERKEIEIFSSELNISSIDELKKKINTSAPVILNISGKGIIIKQFENSGGKELTELFNELFPNSNFNDFHFQLLSKKGTGFIALCRSNFIENVIADFKESGFEIVELNIGPLTISSITNKFEAISNKEFVFNTSKYQLKLSNHEIVKIDSFEYHDSLEKSVSISDIKIPFLQLINYSSAICFFEKPIEIIRTNLLEIKSSFDEHIEKIKFKKVLQASSAIFLVILLINFVVFSYFFSHNKTYQQIISSNSVLLQKFDSLNAEYNSKSDLLKSSGFDKNSRTSYYADQIVSGMPESIQLIELNIFPVSKFNVEQSQLKLERNKIVISGLSQNSIEFNEWLKNLKNKKWVRSIDITRYSQTKNSDSEFSLLCLL